MNKKLVILPVVLGIILGTLLTGCAPAAVNPVDTAVPNSTLALASTATPASTEVPADTATPVAPTAEPTAVPTTAPTATQAPAAEGAVFPLTVTDSLGREVTIPSKPARLISLAPSVTEILFAVGAGDQVVGVTSFCNYPAEATTREVVGGFDPNTISVEKIVSLKPDLVFVEDIIHQPIIDALDKLHIPVVAVAARTVAGVYDNITFVGQVTGHPAEAAQVVTSMQDRINAVATRLANLPTSDRPTVFWEMWDEPLMTTGPNTFTSQIIELAGGVNIFADVTQDYPQVSLEEVVSRNPAVIMSADTHGDKLSVEQVAQRPGWANIDAVKNNRIYLLNGDIVSRAGPRLADAVEAAARALHPELFQ